MHMRSFYRHRRNPLTAAIVRSSRVGDARGLAVSFPVSAFVAIKALAATVIDATLFVAIVAVSRSSFS